MGDLNDLQSFLPRYNLYKKATSYIAGWIAETAASVGFDVKGRTVKDRSQSKAKSKGKKGKKKQPDRGADSAGDGGAKTVYQIRVSDFIPMAKAIAEAGSVAESEIMVPVSLCKYFNRVIQTRRKVSRWYQSRFTRDKASDSRHEYFIEILEETFTALKPFLGSVDRRLLGIALRPYLLRECHPKTASKG